MSIPLKHKWCFNCSIETNKRVCFYHGMDHVGDPLAVVKIIQLGKKKPYGKISILENENVKKKLEIFSQ